jgi:hypothetical protein
LLDLHGAITSQNPEQQARESVYLDKEGSKSKNAFLQRLRPAKSIKFVILEITLGQQEF